MVARHIVEVHVDELDAAPRVPAQVNRSPYRGSQPPRTPLGGELAVLSRALRPASRLSSGARAARSSTASPRRRAPAPRWRSPCACPCRSARPRSRAARRRDVCQRRRQVARRQDDQLRGAAQPLQLVDVQRSVREFERREQRAVRAKVPMAGEVGDVAPSSARITAAAVACRPVSTVTAGIQPAEAASSAVAWRRRGPATSTTFAAAAGGRRLAPSQSPPTARPSADGRAAAAASPTASREASRSGRSPGAIAEALRERRDQQLVRASAPTRAPAQHRGSLGAAVPRRTSRTSAKRSHSSSSGPAHRPKLVAGEPPSGERQRRQVAVELDQLHQCTVAERRRQLAPAGLAAPLGAEPAGGVARQASNRAPRARPGERAAPAAAPARSRAARSRR